MWMRTIAISFPIILTGCASTLSGLDGGSQFACKAPDGVTCSSLSGVYANAVADNLPALEKQEKPKVLDAENTKPVLKKGAVIVGSAPSSGDPIRIPPKMLRIWIAPWEDSEGDLHDQSYIYVMTDPGRWLIEYNRKRISDRYQPTFIANSPQPMQKPAQVPRHIQGSGVVLPGSQSYVQAGDSPAAGGNGE